MASSINASTSGAGGVITTADNSGILNLQSAGNTVATIQPSGLSLPTGSTFNAANTFGFKNRLINGNFYINQRGYSSGTSGYTVDRWQVAGASSSGLVTSGLPANFQQGVQVTRTAAAGTGNFYQNIESKNCFDLVGQTVTLSFWAQNVTGITAIIAQLGYASATDNFATVTNITTTTVSSSPSASWTQYTATFTNLPSGVTNGIQVYLGGTTASTGTVAFTGAQLEVGSQATSFDVRPYGTELALCQRYYWKNLYASGNALSFMVGAAGYNSTTIGQAYCKLPVTMRAQPTSTISGVISGYNGTILTSTGIATTNSSVDNGVLNFSFASGITTGSTYSVISTTIGSYIDFSAEL